MATALRDGAAARNLTVGVLASATPPTSPPSLNIVLFCHPGFRSSQSMPRFARMLQASYQDRGHQVSTWTPRAKFFRWFSDVRLAKWAGYIDEYLLFPAWVRRQLGKQPPDTLFVFCDQALGPWVPLVKNRPHVVHVHDLLALRSALGLVAENPTALTGRIFQRYIRRGYRAARHFISISRKTRDDLHRYGGVEAVTSEVVYNALNFPFSRLPVEQARAILVAAAMPAPEAGMLLHIGGGQWYKNLKGVVAMYARYAADVSDPLPLWIVCPSPGALVRTAAQAIRAPGQVVFFKNLDSLTLHALYSLARVFLFPSLAEGFGWPIIEALACGCPVITTAEAPMNEVGGDVADYLPRLQAGADVDAWATQGARRIRAVLGRSAEECVAARDRGIAWASRFTADTAIDAYLAIYRKVLSRAPSGVRA